MRTLLYGAETWPITVANGRRLEAGPHAWLRRIVYVLWMAGRKRMRESGPRGAGLHHQKETPHVHVAWSCG